MSGFVNVPFSRAAVVPDATQSGRILLGATVLLFQLDAPVPIRVDVWLPASAYAAVGKRPTARAFFALDLGAAVPPGTLAGMYQVYLFAADKVAGPVPLTVQT